MLTDHEPDILPVVDRHPLVGEPAGEGEAEGGVRVAEPQLERPFVGPGPDQVGKTTNIPPSMHQSYRRLSAANPKLRLSAANFVEQGKKIGGFFETPLIRLTDDIESLGLKSDEEREEFLK